MKSILRIRHIISFITAVIMLITVATPIAKAETDTTKTTFSFTQQFKMGNVAVADFNTTDGISLYSKSSVRNEKDTPDGTVFTYEAADSSYPRVSNKDGIFISGTYDNSAIVFYVKETTDDAKLLSINTINKDEADFFAGIESDRMIASSVSMAVSVNGEIIWRTIISDKSYDDVTTDIDYTECPFDSEKNAYMIALRTDKGMTCFQSIQLSGLEIVEITDCRKPLFYKDGVLMQGLPDNNYEKADSTVNFNLSQIRNITSCNIIENDFSDHESPIKAFLQNLYNFLVRIINNILSIFR